MPLSPPDLASYRPHPTICKECGRKFTAWARSYQKYIIFLADNRRCPECDHEHGQQILEHAVEGYRREYQGQLDALRRLPYKEYLQTEHWDRVRRKALQRACYRCQLCNDRSPLQVHHRSYENRGRETAKDLIALCSRCHQKFHDIIPQWNEEVGHDV